MVIDFVEPVEVLRMRRHRINNKEGFVILEDFGRIWKELACVDESPKFPFRITPGWGL